MECRDINLRVIRLEYKVPKELWYVRRGPVVVPKKKIPEISLEKAPVTPLNELIEDLLADIYGYGSGKFGRTSESERCPSDFGKITAEDLVPLSKNDVSCMVAQLKNRIQQYGCLLVKRLNQRDTLKRRGEKLCGIITRILVKIDAEGDGDMRFSVSPKGGTCGWAEWLKAMKLVARLPTGIPPEFRRKLWITLAEQHLKVKGVDWARAEKVCFSEWTNPDDTELGVQIVKDLHRTGCSSFCGAEGRENQAVLKRVLLAYARWNKAVGYCQGFNMLAALILEVMDRSESDSLKVMIYLIEAVLPEGYFANNLRGLSVDMAAFRDLLKLRLPRLSAHLEKLQKGAADGSCYEPPLTNVFTMQWFLTLFCNCLPRNTVLRVWDLVFLEGDEILLTTALAIWDTLQDRILMVESADEFYSTMGELARQTLEAPPESSEALLVRAAQLGPVPELPKLRDKHRYNITPWAHSVQSAAKKGLRLFYSEDETDSSDEGDKLAITTAYGLQSAGRGRNALVAAGVFGHPDREKLALDISALKQQYARLRERQRQAHIILAAACARQPSVGSSSGPGPISVNHLLLGKSAIVSARGRRLGPPQGAIPPSRSKTTPKPAERNKTETLSWKDENQKVSLVRRDSIKWKDIKRSQSDPDEDPEEGGNSVPESEVDEIIQTSMRTRRKSESSSYSECSESSTSTSLCDEPNRMSDFDSEPASISDSHVEEFKEEITPAEDVEKIEKNNAEFGNYIQEFEELLDKTKNMETIDTAENIEDIPHRNYSQDIEEIVDKTKKIEIENFEENTENTKAMQRRKYVQELEEFLDKTKNMHKDSVKNEETTQPLSSIENYDHIIDETTNIILEALDDTYDISETLQPLSYIQNFEQFVDTAEMLLEAANDIDNKAKLEPLIYPQDLDKTKDNDLDTIDNITDSEMKIIQNFDHPLDKSKNIEMETSVDNNETSQPRNYVQELKDLLEKTKSIEMEAVNVEDSEVSQSRNYVQEFKDLLDKTNDTEIKEINEAVDNKVKSPEVEKERSFDEFVDSTRGKSLRSYLDEFRKAEDSKKDDDAKRSIADDDLENYPPNLRNIEEQRIWDSIEEAKNRSDSCDRSISSSVSSSMSPVLRCITALAEDPPSYMCYKSPTRVDSDQGSELEEDEKPIVLKIDKYFEHSPEFFGARTSGGYISSDDEDEPYGAKRRKSSGERKTWTDTYVTDMETFERIIQDEIDKSREDNEQQSPKQQEDKTIADSARPNVLEKTKSEELPSDRRRHFSILDDEIEAIRSQSGRRNSERALKIIQENSKILHRILVNQVNKANYRECFREETSTEVLDQEREQRLIEYGKQKPLPSPRSVSLDDSHQRRTAAEDDNKTDTFGWENKGFNVNRRLTLYSPPTLVSEDNRPKTENNNSLSESYNVTSPYRVPFRPKCETSQESETCAVSSSMSFSFEPSSSKPQSFNSSDTLCQLTSLDQVSTPISPKVIVSERLAQISAYPAPKDLSPDLERFRLKSEGSSDTATASPKSPGSPISSLDRSPEKVFSPFPMKQTLRQPKELGYRLGLYKDPLKSPSK